MVEDFTGGYWLAGGARGRRAIGHFEVSAHNGVTDIQGDASDWIELRNDGGQAIELGGFTLNDGFGTGGAVPLPNITLDAGERLLILASGEDRTYLPENWRCPAVEGDQWQYVVPTPPLPTTGGYRVLMLPPGSPERVVLDTETTTM